MNTDHPTSGLEADTVAASAPDQAREIKRLRGVVAIYEVAVGEIIMTAENPDGYGKPVLPLIAQKGRSCIAKAALASAKASV